MKKINKSINKYIFLAFPFFFLLIFLILPLINLLIFALTSNSQFSLDSFIKVISHPLNSYFFIWNIYQALLTTIMALILGVPFAYILNRYNFIGKNLLRSLITVPFLLPPIVVLMSFLVVFGNGGWVNSLWQSVFDTQLISIFGTTEGIVLAHLFYNLPVVIRLSELGFSVVDPDLAVVSKSLGISQIRYIIQIMLPQVLPSILTASLLVFIYAFNSFAIVLILGGVQLQTLEVRIYSLAKYSFDYNQAAALTMIQLGLNLIVIMVYLFLSSKYDHPSHSQYRKKLNLKIKFTINFLIKICFFSLISFLVIFICIFPILGLIIASFLTLDLKFTLSNFGNLLDGGIKSFIGVVPQTMIVNTVIIGFIVMGIAITLALLLNYGLHYETTNKGNPKFNHISWSSMTNLIVILPLVVSSISLAFSIFSLYRSSFLFSNPGLVIIIAHALIAFPFANRIIATGRANINKDFITIGHSLGLSRFKAFLKIEIPLLTPYIVVSALFSLAISIGEFGATNFIAKGNYVTIPVGIYRLINSRHINEATAFSVILVFFTLGLFIITEKIGRYNFKL